MCSMYGVCTDGLQCDMEALSEDHKDVHVEQVRYILEFSSRWYCTVLIYSYHV